MTRPTKPKPVDVNTCSVQQLLELELKGFSDKKATALIDHRRRCGAYKDWKAVLEVDGIGQKTVNKLQLAGVILAKQPAAASSQAAAGSACFGAPAKPRAKPEKQQKQEQKQQPATRSVTASSAVTSQAPKPTKQSDGIFKRLFGQYKQPQQSHGSKPAAAQQPVRPHSTQAHLPNKLQADIKPAQAPSKPAHAPDSLAGAPEKGQRWWETCGDPNAPFPPEFAVSKKQPRSYDYVRIAPEDPTRMIYKGRLMSQQETADMQEHWKRRYPVLHGANDQGNGRETVSMRAAGTGKEAHRIQAWQELLDFEGTDAIPKHLRDCYRCDPYGNVVSIKAKGEAMCAWELDHVFPWSRGGLSVPANFMAVHFGANRHVKRSKIRNAFTQAEADAMQTGLSVEQFLELFNRLEQAGRTRRDSSALRAHLDTLLLTNYGLSWHVAASMPAGHVYRYLNAAYRQHLDKLDSLPQSPMQRVVTAAKDVFKPGESIRNRQQQAGKFDDMQFAMA